MDVEHGGPVQVLQDKHPVNVHHHEKGRDGFRTCVTCVSALRRFIADPRPSEACTEARPLHRALLRSAGLEE